tara:strand:- start:672 stop:1469 length:798 start_codon:yes stop_codon:yes gene_type:complete
MQVSNQIDQLIQSLNALRPLLSDDKEYNAEKFSKVLKESLENLSTDENVEKQISTLSNQKMEDGMPNWVDPQYGYDFANPRKPNMLELIQAISGKAIKEVRNEEYESISSKAVEILHVTAPSFGEDTRDWAKIMAAEDIIAAARLETAKMYEPKVDIEARTDDNGGIIDQMAVIKDKNGKTLTTIPVPISSAEKTLRNFGVASTSIPSNLEDKVIAGKFDKDLLTFLENFDKDSDAVETLVIQATTDAISARLSEEIPLHEYNKL